MGIVRYEDPECPLKVTLEAFSPFIPLDLQNSSYPATVMRYTLENGGDKAVTAEIAGWTDNPRVSPYRAGVGYSAQEHDRAARRIDRASLQRNGPGRASSRESARYPVRRFRTERIRNVDRGRNGVRRRSGSHRRDSALSG